MKKILFALAFAGAAGAMAITACSSSSPVHDAPDAGNKPDTGVVVDGGGSDSPSQPTCFTDPKNHFEIINACTDAQAITKVVNLPKLNPDGSLPPLP